MTTPKPLMSADDLHRFFDNEFPQINEGGPFYSVSAIEPGIAILKLQPDDRHLRPGGTVSGPTLFALADLAAFAVILAHIGPVAMAVTTNVTINFLRKPPSTTALFCTARLLKLGKRLAVVDAAIASERDGAPDDKLVAQASATYSLPPT